MNKWEREGDWNKGYSLYVALFLLTINAVFAFINTWPLFGDRLISHDVIFMSVGLPSIAFLWALASLLLLVFNKSSWKWLWLVFLLYGVLPFPRILYVSFYAFHLNVIWLGLLIVHLKLNPSMRQPLNRISASRQHKKRNAFTNEMLNHKEEFKDLDTEELVKIANSKEHQASAVAAAREMVLNAKPDLSYSNYSADNLSVPQKRAITDLWNTVFPAPLGFADLRGLENWMSGLKHVQFTLVANVLDELLGCFIAFERNEERFFSILVADKAQGRGIGTELMHRAKQNYAVLYGWMVDAEGYQRADGTDYLPPKAFYLKNGFEVLENERWDNEKIKSVKIRWRKE